MPNWLHLEKHPGPFLSARMMLMKAGVREKMANLKALWRFLQQAQVSGTLRVSITKQVSTKLMAEQRLSYADVPALEDLSSSLGCGRSRAGQRHDLPA